MRMKQICESEREVSDLGKEKVWKNWVKKNNGFKNPFDGMKWDEEEFLL